MLPNATKASASTAHTGGSQRKARPRNSSSSPPPASTGTSRMASSPLPKTLTTAFINTENRGGEYCS